MLCVNKFIEIGIQSQSFGSSHPVKHQMCYWIICCLSHFVIYFAEYELNQKKQVTDSMKPFLGRAGVLGSK